MIDAVRDQLLLDAVKPLTDALTVRAPEHIDFVVEATLVIPHGPDAATVRQAAQAALSKYLAAWHKVGRSIYRSGITAALSVPSVETVLLASPAGNVLVGPDEVAWAVNTSISTQIAD